MMSMRNRLTQPTCKARMEAIGDRIMSGDTPRSNGSMALLFIAGDRLAFFVGS